MLKHLTIVVLAALTLTGCNVEPSSSEEGEQENEETMIKARANQPTPQTSHFLTRAAVVKWMERMDVPGKTFYVYLLGNNGQAVGYYVAQTRPISACTALTPPDKERSVRGSGANPLGAAPGLDGVYHAGKCDSYFFFDAATDAYIEIQGLNFFVADQPLSIKADPIRVASE